MQIEDSEGRPTWKLVIFVTILNFTTGLTLGYVIWGRLI